MEKLKEHRSFRNQLIISTILLMVFGYKMDPTFYIFGGMIGLLALYNVYTYHENKKDYLKLKNRK